MRDVMSDPPTDHGEFMFAAIESLPRLAWMCDAKGTCFYANRCFKEYSRNVLGEKARLNWLDLISRDEEADSAEQWMAATPEGRPFTGELRLRARGGETRWHDVSVVPVHAAGGEVRFWFGLADDVSERKQRGSDVVTQRFALEAARSGTVANLTVSAMAHDLNQPLAAAGTYASVAMRLLRSKVTDRDTFEHALEQVIREIRRAGKMFKDICDAPPIIEPELESLDLAQLARDAVSKLREQATGGFSRIKVEIAGSLESVVGNRVWLENSLQALINLREPLSPEPPSRDVVVTVMPTADGMRGQITIQHLSPPLDDETIRTVYKPHYSFRSGPVGLNLAVNRALLEAQGGEFWTEPNRHEGPAYCITLPFAASPKVSAAVPGIPG